MNPDPHAKSTKQIDQAAAEWFVRSERGLTASEQDAYLQWLLADARHGVAVAKHQDNWSRLDALGDWRPEHSRQPNRDLLAPEQRPILRFLVRSRQWSVPLAMAAALAVGFFFFPRLDRPETTPTAEVALVVSPIEEQILEDGSVISLNRGAEVAIHYSAEERRVELIRGEALFKVAKNPDRPFIVQAGGIAVRAIGTAFNVRLDANGVDVLVTEGVVGVHSVETVADGQPEAAPFRVSAGERTTVPLVSSAAQPEVEPVSPTQVNTLLAWQPRMLDFTAEPLAVVVNEFNRHNVPIHVALADAELAQLQVSATLRSDNIEGFIRMLESGFDVQVKRSGQTITLSSAPERF